MSSEVWKPCVTATIAYEYRKIFEQFAEKTGSPVEFVEFQGHDFSARGMSGAQDASQAGLGHLLSFMGTDTVSAIRYAEEFYGSRGPIGLSVPATEHSVMSMGSEGGEIQTFERLITEVYPKGIVSIVSDTWDFFRVLGEYVPLLSDKILAREGKVVFRPDSGNPADIICGNPDTNGLERKGALEVLWDHFGGTTTEKGYKVLNEKVGLIYGDSITLDRANEILSRMEAKGFASANIVFGIGSFTYQYMTRDNFGFAMKATHGTVKGQDRIISKKPKTDDGGKFSAQGLLRVEGNEEGFVLHEKQTREQEGEGLLELVFLDGKQQRHQNLDEVREALRNE